MQLQPLSAACSVWLFTSCITELFLTLGNRCPVAGKDMLPMHTNLIYVAIYYICQQHDIQFPPGRKILRWIFSRLLSRNCQSENTECAASKEKGYIAGDSIGYDWRRTTMWTTPLDWNLPNISHPMLYALQRAIDSGLCRTPLIIMLLFFFLPDTAL